MPAIFHIGVEGYELTARPSSGVIGDPGKFQMQEDFSGSVKAKYLVKDTNKWSLFLR